MRRAAVLGAVVLVVVATSGALAAPDFTVSIPGSIDTPEKTVSVEGDTYTISSIARVEQGDTLRVDTSGPDDEEYRVYVHGVVDGTREVQDTKFVGPDADGTVTFDTSEFAPGSYTVSVYDADTGEYYSPHPVVVPAFETTVDAPSSATAEDSFDVTVSTSRIESGPSIRGVELVFSNGDATKRVDATGSDGEYTASVSLSKTGDWQVYAAVTSNEEAPKGEYELVGISDPVTVTVETEKSTTTTTSTTTSTATSSTSTTSSSNGGDSGGGADTTSTTRTTGSTTSTTTRTTTTATTTEPTTTKSTPTTDSSTSTTTSVGSTSTATTSSVIEPNDDSTTTPSNNSNGVAGGVPLALLALLASLALFTRQTK